MWYVDLNLFIMKLENRLKKHVRNVAETKYRFAKLVVIFLFFNSRFDFVCEQIKMSINVFLIPGSNLKGCFLKGQYLIEGFHAHFRFRRNKTGGEILLYAWEFK